MLNGLFPLLVTGARNNLLTRSPVDLALALFSYLVLLDGSPASTLARFGETPSADTRRAIQSFDLAIVESDHVKCLHALSSFQRTGSPAKPDGFAAPQRCCLSLAEVPTFSTPRGRFWGNLSRLQPDPTLVKPYFHLRNTVQRLD